MWYAVVPQPRRLPRRSLEAPCRRNPERLSRPHTRSRSAVDGPPSPAAEDPEDRFSLVRRSRFYEDDDELVSGGEGGPPLYTLRSFILSFGGGAAVEPGSVSPQGIKSLPPTGNRQLSAFS